MTQTSLRAVTLETVENYRQVAEHTVGAYRASGHRLLRLLDRSVDRAAARGAERVAPRLANALRKTSSTVTGVAAKGLDRVSARTERAIELGSARVATRVDRVATLVHGIENRYIATGLETAARMSLTGAKVALALSETFAAGASKLSTALEGPPATPAKPVVRRARRTPAAGGRAVAKAARQAAAPVAAEVAKEVRKVARRAKTAAAKLPVAKPAARARRAA